MPHVNYKRGESRVFVFRREHGTSTCARGRHSYGKRSSGRYYKQACNRSARRLERAATLRADEVKDRKIRVRVTWLR